MESFVERIFQEMLQVELNYEEENMKEHPPCIPGNVQGRAFFCIQKQAKGTNLVPRYTVHGYFPLL